MSDLQCIYALNIIVNLKLAYKKVFDLAGNYRLPPTQGHVENMFCRAVAWVGVGSSRSWLGQKAGYMISFSV